MKRQERDEIRRTGRHSCKVTRTRQLLKLLNKFIFKHLNIFLQYVDMTERKTTNSNTGFVVLCQLLQEVWRRMTPCAQLLTIVSILSDIKKNEDEVLISSMTKIKPTKRKEISLEVGCCIESSVRNDQLKHVS